MSRPLVSIKTLRALGNRQFNLLWLQSSRRQLYFVCVCVNCPEPKVKKNREIKNTIFPKVGQSLQITNTDAPQHRANCFVTGSLRSSERSRLYFCKRNKSQNSIICNLFYSLLLIHRCLVGYI